MTRNLILFLAAAVVAGVTPGWLDGRLGVARGQGPAADIAAAADPLPSTEPPALQDNFGDNRKGRLWKLYQDDPNNCWVTETSAHLECRATKEATDAFAGYVGDGWWFDPSEDFEMKADLYYDLVTFEGGWLSFGVTPSPNEPRERYVSLGIGCINRYSSYWREWKDGYEIRWDFASRFKDRVTLYISYDAYNDTLYVSDAGYGSENAWQSVPDLIQGRWGRQPLFVFLGGSAEGASIGAGHAFIDNFVIDSGGLVKVNEPNGPADPNDGSSGEEQKPDVTVPVFIVPSVIGRNDPDNPVTAIAGLPDDIGPADIDEMEPLLLWPGALEAMEQTVFRWLNGRTIVMASFSKTAILEAIPEDGPAELRFTGRLKDGRYFGGPYTITIR